MKRLDRLRRMTRREVSWRVRAQARIHRDRLLARVQPPRWDRADIGRLLASDVIDAPVRNALERHDWGAVHRALAAAMRARPRTFVLDADSALALRTDILRRWPDAAADASRRADRIMGGRFDLLGYRDLSFSTLHGRVDWHADPVHRRRAPGLFWADVPYLDPAVGDHKIIWELNRHQHWLTLGRALWLTRDRRYGWAIVSELEDWLNANPPLTGINWASSLELALRSLSWIWALHALLADTDEGAAGRARTPWLVDVLVGLHRQLTHVEQNLSYYFSPNTHLTGEALALYVAGVALPELAAAARWARTGRRILLDEIDRQIGADGGHAERSMHYHRYTLDFYLLALLTAERTDDFYAIGRFTDAVARLAEFARALADDEGRLPLIGDDDGGMLWPLAGRACDDVRDSLALAAVVLGRPELAPWGVPEEVFWIAGRTATELAPFIEASGAGAAQPDSRAFTDTGYVVMRDASGGHLVFDTGAHGYTNGGHAHADALAITFGAGGRPLLVDPGTSTYTMDAARRDRMRSGLSHNTLMLDGEASSVTAGPFHWERTAGARLAASRHNPAFDWSEAAHDGFARARHRRTVFRAPAGGLLIVDEVLGRGRHAADLHWHFHPTWMVTAETANRLRATHLDGGSAWMVHDGAVTWLLRGDEEIGLGWYAPVYGTLVPSWSARVSRVGVAPFAIVTWIDAAGHVTGHTPPTLARLAAECDAGGSAPVAVRVERQQVAWTTLVRPGEPDARETRGGRVGAYHTNGRLLHYGTEHGRLVSITACDASHVLALGDGWLSVAADEPLPDLHVETVGDTIDAWSSAPASRLRLQGGLVAAARAIRVNGRELPVEARERADTAIALPVHWGEPGRITPCVALQASRT